jgi:hypothetical protein
LIQFCSVRPFDPKNLYTVDKQFVYFSFAYTSQVIGTFIEQLYFIGCLLHTPGSRCFAALACVTVMSYSFSSNPMHSPSTLPGRPPTKRLGAKTTFRYIYDMPAVRSMPPSLLFQRRLRVNFQALLGNTIQPDLRLS